MTPEKTIGVGWTLGQGRYQVKRKLGEGGMAFALLALDTHLGDTIATFQAHFKGDGKKGVDRGQPMPVGSFAANAWGLHDMHGNVIQWCEDRYGPKYYETSPNVDPLNTTKGQTRVYRGGSWSSLPAYLRSAYRGNNEPDYRFNSVGFRVVLVSP